MIYPQNRKNKLNTYITQKLLDLIYLNLIIKKELSLFTISIYSFFLYNSLKQFKQINKLIEDTFFSYK